MEQVGHIMGALGGGAFWTALGTLIGLWLRNRIPLRKMELDSEASVIAMMRSELERTQAESRATISDMNGRFQVYMAQADIELKTTRHELASVVGQLRYLTGMLRMVPDPPPLMMQAINEAMRMQEAEGNRMALERGTTMAAKVGPVTVDNPTPVSA